MIRHQKGRTSACQIVTLCISLMVCMLMAGNVHAALSCSGCHSMPPTDSAGARDASTGSFKGNHTGHADAGVKSCTPCHGDSVSSYDSAHSRVKVSNRKIPIINIASKIHNYSTANGRAYYSRGIFLNQTSVPPNPLGTCSNVNCHFEATTPAWGSANYTSPSDCDRCHGAAPNSGNHPYGTQKHATYYGTGTSSCVKCHPDHTADAKPFAHATSAGGRNLSVSFVATPNNGSGSYSGMLNDYLPSQTNAFGTCTATYCHSNGKKTLGNFSTNTIPTWGSSLPANCTGCHRADNASGVAMASGSHGRHLNYSIACSRCHAATVNSSMAIVDIASHVNGKVTIKFNSLSTAVNGTYGGQPTPYNKTPGTVYGQCNNVSCHFNTTTPAWGTAAPLNCLGCHNLASLLASGAHAKHISASAIPTMYNYTANRSTAAEYDFGCSNCHPLAISNHMNGIINVTLKKDEAGIGSLRSKNSATAVGIGVSNSGVSGTSKVNIVCTATYCHSNGNAAALVYAVTPNWYGGAFTGDHCANCHGNAPNSTIAGSKAHFNNRFLGYTSTAGGHQIGIHAMKIYSSPAGLAHAGTAGSSSHGNAATATTISCNICHYATVATARNDSNPVCATCHYPGNSVGAQSGNLAAIANKSKHVNGIADIVFQPVNILSKAQMRAGSFNMSLYSSVWKRNVGYKTNGAYDSAKGSLDTSIMWNSSTKTCSNVACHNGQSVKWSDNDGATNCVSCHTTL